MSRMNWDRVNAENLGARRGCTQMESIPPTPPKTKKKKSRGNQSNQQKRENKIVPVEQISDYLGCNHGMLVTSLQHLARDSAWVEVLPGQWVRIHCMAAAPPSHTKVGPMCPETAVDFAE
jgi:hypothetical protein